MKSEPAPVFNSEAGSARAEVRLVLMGYPARSFPAPWELKPLCEAPLYAMRPCAKVGLQICVDNDVKLRYDWLN